MAYNAAGRWEYEDANVAPRVTNLLQLDNPLIAQARSQGLAASNRRGMLNSSMSAGAAQAEANKVVVPIAMQEAQQIQQSNLAEQDRNSQLERLTTDAGFTAQRQGVDIAAQLQRLREGAGFDLDKLNRQGEITSEQQQRELASSMERLRESGAQSLTQQERGFGFQTQLSAQAAAQEMTRLQASLAGADDQQRRQIEADMQRLRESGAQALTQQERGFGFQSQLQTQAGTIERERITLQGNIEAAMQASGAEQQRALANLQGQIQTGLQTLANDQQLQRMQAEFSQQTGMQAKEQEYALQRLTQSGDQELARLAAVNSGENERLAATIAQGDRQNMAAAIVNIFQSEANMRAALLNNPSMPAAERSAYERAIAQLGTPARVFLNQLYSAPPVGAPPPAGGTGGTGIPPVPPPPPPFSPGGTDLGGGGGGSGGGGGGLTAPTGPAGGLSGFDSFRDILPQAERAPEFVRSAATPSPFNAPAALPTSGGAGLNAGAALTQEELLALQAQQAQRLAASRSVGAYQ